MNLKEMRKQQNITQDELAKKFNISRGYLSKLENNLMYPSNNLAKKIAKYFNIKDWTNLIKP